MRLISTLIAAALAAPLVGCQPPPPAPEGLGDSTSYLVREFFSDDAMFQAGIQGFMNWFNTEGYDLVGKSPTDPDSENETEAFTVPVLEQEDVDYIPLHHDPPRDISAAAGVVSLAEMGCDVATSEDYLLRVDQDVVFDEDWESYERTFHGDRAVFQQALIDGEFDAVPEAQDALADDWDPTPFQRTILLSENQANPISVLGADMPPYPLYLHTRHGVYDIDGEGDMRKAFAIITYMLDTVSGPDGQNFLHQSYSVEINVEMPPEGDLGERTLRMLAVWAEPEGSGLSPDSPMVLNYAVNKSLKSSERMSAICAGDIEIPAEP